MGELLADRLSHAEIVRLLLALNRRAVRAEELAGFAAAMRGQAAPVFAAGEAAPENLVDTCGTGGDGAGTFNISTAAAIVAAAAGARVAKHGNRSASSRCGSADVLEALGVRIDIAPEKAGQAIRKIGLGFLFAPAAHAAARHAAAARKEIGVRTVFNLLGPLTNPAGARAQVLGVYGAEALDTMAEALKQLGVARALVVHGDGGLDEISLSGETRVLEVRDGVIAPYAVSPEMFGAARAPLAAIAGGTAQENAAILAGVLDENAGDGNHAARDVVVLNAAAALVAAGVREDFSAAAVAAREAIRSGKARKKLQELVEFTNE
jgi:anthranilate phosphoribosyltransferase